MRQDKKNKGGEVYMVILRSIGEVYSSGGQYSHPVDESIIQEVLSD
jgi:3-dehydroquinate synthetase